MNQIFVYARISAVDQNTDTQLDALSRHGCDRIFEEKIKGMATQRPTLDEMLALLRAGDTLVVSRFNRLGRSCNHLIDLVSKFADRSIVFKALNLGIDSSTVAGKLVLRIFSALAYYKRETILEKNRAGQLLAKVNGKHIGRFKGPNTENYARVKTAL